MSQTILSATSTLARQTVTDGRSLAAASPSADGQNCLRHERNGSDRFRVAAVLPSLPKIGTLFLHRVVKLFMGVHHVLMRLLDGIQLLLLISR